MGLEHLGMNAKGMKDSGESSLGQSFQTLSRYIPPWLTRDLDTCKPS